MDTKQKVMPAVIDQGGQIDPNQTQLRLALFDMAGNPIDLTTDTGAEVLLTGYTPHAVGAVIATDSVNIAIAKLEARVAALEAA